MKNFLQNKEFKLDDILFESRNKSYGAYALRNDADRILTRSMFYGVIVFGILSATPFIMKSLKVTDVVATADDGDRRLIDITEPITPEVKPETQPVQPPKPEVATFDSTVPTPTRNPEVEKPAANINQYDNALASTQDREGDRPTVPYIAPTNVPQGPVVIDKPIKPDPVVPDDGIKTQVDVEASFPGGIDVFRNKAIQNFDTSDFDGSGNMLSTMVTFIVEKDGSITSIKASGSDTSFNKEAESTIKKLKGKWIPAKIKGQPVRSYFKFPISMRFE